MARRVFFSFHYKQDHWRAAQVRNMGVVEGNRPVSDNDWESIVRQGDEAIKRWIDEQLKGKSCTIVLIGEKTSERKWVRYEIKRSWELGKGLLGIYIHNLKDQDGLQSAKGRNPFELFELGGENLARIVRAYDPPYATSQYVYDYIKKHIADWVEEAISIRGQYS